MTRVRQKTNERNTRWQSRTLAYKIAYKGANGCQDNGSVDEGVKRE